MSDEAARHRREQRDARDSRASVHLARERIRELEAENARLQAAARDAIVACERLRIELEERDA